MSERRMTLEEFKMSNHCSHRSPDNIEESLYYCSEENKDLKNKIEDLVETIRFYADPESYFAIGFFPDSPCGEFINDFEEINKNLGYKPGKKAREILYKYGEYQEAMEEKVDYYLSMPYNVKVEQDEDSDYIAWLEEFDSNFINGFGETKEEALNDLETTKKNVFFDYIKNGIKFPEPLKNGLE